MTTCAVDSGFRLQLSNLPLSQSVCLICFSKVMLHCFEGTIKKYASKGAVGKKAKFGLRTTNAAVWVQWDKEFEGNGYVKDEMALALNPDLYNNEKQHGGWNVLSADYVRWQQVEGAEAGAMEVDAQGARGGAHV